MNKLDALARVVLKYITEHDGQTILSKDIIDETGMNPTTVRTKIRMLIERGYIRREGTKKYFVIPKED